MKRTLLIAAVVVCCGCDSLKSKVCTEASAGSSPSGAPAAGVGPEGAEAASGKGRFLYARARYFQNPLIRKDEVPVLHMCWYAAESKQTFATPSQFEIALQTDPAVAKITSLYEFFTPAADLAIKYQDQSQSNPADFEKAGLSQLTLVMGDLDRLALGIGNVIHPAPVALVALGYFGGQFVQPGNEDGTLTKRAIKAQLAGAVAPPPTATSAASKAPSAGSAPSGAAGGTGSGANAPKAKVSMPSAGSLQSLSPEAVELIEKSIRSWGVNAPPEEILRLPIEILAEFACPAY